jgi:hypothetical protein
MMVHAIVCQRTVQILFIFLDETRARLIEYLKKTYHLTKLPDPDEIELVIEHCCLSLSFRLLLLE